MRVLVVDDSEAVRARLVTLLDEASDADVDEARDGAHAIALSRALAPDVVVLDLHLVGPTSGLDVLRFLKSRPHPPTVVILTNDASSHHRRECLSLGADHFFDKSKEFALVAEVVQSASSVGAWRATRP